MHPTMFPELASEPRRVQIPLSCCLAAAGSQGSERLARPLPGVAPPRPPPPALGPTAPPVSPAAQRRPLTPARKPPVTSPLTRLTHFLHLFFLPEKQPQRSTSERAPLSSAIWAIRFQRDPSRTRSAIFVLLLPAEIKRKCVAEWAAHTRLRRSRLKPPISLLPLPAGLRILRENKTEVPESFQNKRATKSFFHAPKQRQTARWEPCVQPSVKTHPRQVAPRSTLPWLVGLEGGGNEHLGKVSVSREGVRSDFFLGRDPSHQVPSYSP